MTSTFNNENTYIVSREDITMWAKAENILFKRVEDHLKKLEKNKESFVIHWLNNKNIVVVTKSSTKEFHYVNPSE